MSKVLFNHYSALKKRKRTLRERDRILKLVEWTKCYDSRHINQTINSVIPNE